MYGNAHENKKMSNIDFVLETEIDQIKEDEHYKYLSILQSDRSDVKTKRKNDIRYFKNRMHSIGKIQLNGKNKVKVITLLLYLC